MDTPVAVTKFETKSHNSPDEVRAPNKTRVEVVRLPGYTLGSRPQANAVPCPVPERTFAGCKLLSRIRLQFLRAISSTGAIRLAEMLSLMLRTISGRLAPMSVCTPSADGAAAACARWRAK